MKKGLVMLICIASPLLSLGEDTPPGALPFPALPPVITPINNPVTTTTPPEPLPPAVTAKYIVPEALTRPPEVTQMFQLQAGSFSPHAIKLSNGDYSFTYDVTSQSNFLFSAGWSIKFLRFLGRWDFEENLETTSYSGTAQTDIRGRSGNQDVRLNLAALDTRIMYSMDWFPVRAIVPFVDGGYQFSLYNQSGTSDLDSAHGGVGNLVAGAGLRIWLNYKSFFNDDVVAKYTTTPVYLTAKANWIYSSNQSVDLSSESFLFGVAVGL